jgi:hypothetical protein
LAFQTARKVRTRDAHARILYSCLSARHCSHNNAIGNPIMIRNEVGAALPDYHGHGTLPAMPDTERPDKITKMTDVVEMANERTSPHARLW